MNGKRIWYPFTFTDRNSQIYRVSFLIAEEATWDHRFHDLDGREIGAASLNLTAAELRSIQASCDGAVGSAQRCPRCLARHDADAHAARRAGGCLARSPARRLQNPPEKRCPRVASKDYAGAKSPLGRRRTADRPCACSHQARRGMRPEPIKRIPAPAARTPAGRRVRLLP